MLRRAILPFVLFGFAVISPVLGGPPVLTANLSGEQVVPGNNSLGTGDFKLFIFPDNHVVYSGSWRNLSGIPTAVHFHIARRGEPPVLVIFNVQINFQNQTVEGSAMLSPFEVEEVKSGHGCVDYHTIAFPDGEIRGQLSAPREVDYNGDGCDDLSNVRYTNFGNEPYTFIDRDSATGQATFTGPLGISQRDTFCTGNFDGDGKTDHCIYRDGASAGQQSFFYIIRSSDGVFQTRPFGLRGDQPCLGTYDDDEITDLCIFRKGGAQFAPAYWWREYSTIGQGVHFATQFGTTGFQTLSGDLPVPANWDSDGKYDIAVYRFGPGLDPNNYFIILQSSTGTVRFEQFGEKSTDFIVPRCDWDGDQRADLTVARTGAFGTPMTWIYKESSTGTTKFLQWGTSTDVPVPMDEDGDGRTDACVFRRGQQSYYYCRESLNGSFEAIQWGIGTDTPIAHWFVK